MSESRISDSSEEKLLWTPPFHYQTVSTSRWGSAAFRVDERSLLWKADWPRLFARGAIRARKQPATKHFKPARGTQRAGQCTLVYARLVETTHLSLERQGELSFCLYSHVIIITFIKYLKITKLVTKTLKFNLILYLATLGRVCRQFEIY